MGNVIESALKIFKEKILMNETVCAIVVTYNRKKLLLECLDAL